MKEGTLDAAGKHYFLVAGHWCSELKSVVFLSEIQLVTTALAQVAQGVQGSLALHQEMMKTTQGIVGMRLPARPMMANSLPWIQVTQWTNLDIGNILWWESTWVKDNFPGTNLVQVMRNKNSFQAPACTWLYSIIKINPHILACISLQTQPSSIGQL